MAFFTPKAEFTHWGRFYGIPVYFSEVNSEGPKIAGTNIIWDWCVIHIAPFIHWLVDTIRYYQNPDEYEPMDWMLEIRGKL